MKMFKKLLLVAIIAGLVLLGGMITQGWEIGGTSWDDIKKQVFPTKKAFEKQRNNLIEKAEEAAGD